MNPDTDSKFPIPEFMANLPNLRLRALQLVGTESDTPLDVKEMCVLGWITSQEVIGGTDNPLITYLGHDIEGLELNRFTALAGWLAPYSLAGSYPKALARIARFILGDTREQEWGIVNWEEMRRRYPTQNF